MPDPMYGIQDDGLALTSGPDDGYRGISRWPLMKVISGGQTGADQAGLRAAKALGYMTGGWVPRGWRTDDGPAPWLGTEYGCCTDESNSYRPRTRRNVYHSTGTILFGHAASPGSALTCAFCQQYGKPLALADGWDATAIRAWVIRHQIETLNVAGNRERTNQGIGARVEAILRDALGR